MPFGYGERQILPLRASNIRAARCAGRALRRSRPQRPGSACRAFGRNGTATRGGSMVEIHLEVALGLCNQTSVEPRVLPSGGRTKAGRYRSERSVAHGKNVSQTEVNRRPELEGRRESTAPLVGRPH